MSYSRRSLLAIYVYPVVNGRLRLSARLPDGVFWGLEYTITPERSVSDCLATFYDTLPGPIYDGDIFRPTDRVFTDSLFLRPPSDDSYPTLNSTSSSNPLPQPPVMKESRRIETPQDLPELTPFPSLGNLDTSLLDQLGLSGTSSSTPVDSSTGFFGPETRIANVPTGGQLANRFTPLMTFNEGTRPRRRIQGQWLWFRELDDGYDRNARYTGAEAWIPVDEYPATKPYQFYVFDEVMYPGSKIRVPKGFGGLSTNSAHRERKRRLRNRIDL